MSKQVALHSATLINAAGAPTSINDSSAVVANPKAVSPLLEESANFSNSGVFNSYIMESGSFLRAET